MPYISVVTPVYNAVNIVDELYRRLTETLSRITSDYEIVMVNDACPFGSGDKIQEIARKDSKVKYIGLTRNFGQHIAISAGLDYASGEYVVVMDCDLQDPPDKIPFLLDELKKSGKCACFAVREKRKEGFLKLFYSKAFNATMRLLSDKIFFTNKDSGNFSVIQKKVVNNIRKLKEKNRSYFGLVLWCGFEILYIPVESQKRFEGKSAYTFLKSLKYALHVLLQQSVKPLFISVFFALSSFLVSCAFASLMLYNHLSGNYDLNDWTSIMFAISLTSSAIFLTLAVISLYIANLFEESRNRPLYVIEHTLNLTEKDVC